MRLKFFLEHRPLVLRVCRSAIVNIISTATLFLDSESCVELAAIMATDHSAPAQAPARTRSIFSKRPAWAQPAKAQVDAPDEIFTRRVLDPEELLRQKEEQHQLEAEKAERRALAKAEKEKRKSTEGVNTASKKRRISEQTYADYGLPSPAKQDVGEGVTEATEAPKIDKGKQPARDEAPRSIENHPSIAPTNVISIDSDDDNEAVVQSAHATNPPPEEPIDSDEEFPELVALARERRRLREAEAQAAKDQADAAKQVAPEHDPVIQVLVTSPIENTNPLLVHRRLSQRLMEIRQVWCQRQGFTEEEAQTVFLTYKLRRLYDVTTCKSLGIKVDSNGRVLGDRPEDIFGSLSEDSNAGKVHLIALTEESFAEMKKQREAEKLAAAKAALPFAPEDDEEEAKPQEEEPRIRVLIKAKGYKDYKLIVRPVSGLIILHRYRY